MNDTIYYAAKAAYEEGYESAKEELTAANAEITQLKAQLTQTQGAVTISLNYVQVLEQQRDRLAEALRFATAYPLSESWYKQAIDALATLKL